MIWFHNLSLLETFHPHLLSVFIYWVLWVFIEESCSEFTTLVSSLFLGTRMTGLLEQLKGTVSSIWSWSKQHSLGCIWSLWRHSCMHQIGVLKSIQYQDSSWRYRSSSRWSPLPYQGMIYWLTWSSLVEKALSDSKWRILIRTDQYPLERED